MEGVAAFYKDGELANANFGQRSIERIQKSSKWKFFVHKGSRLCGHVTENGWKNGRFR